jgi:hypothetical protein
VCLPAPALSAMNFANKLPFRADHAQLWRLLLLVSASVPPTPQESKYDQSIQLASLEYFGSALDGADNQGYLGKESKATSAGSNEVKGGSIRLT